MMLDLSNHDAYEVLEFEWAEYNQLDPAGMVACSSGTAALHLALEAMRLPQGSEVVVPDLTMIAVPRAVTLAGLTPVFVDCDDTLNMDPQLVEMGGIQRYQGEWRYVEEKVRCIIAVHTYGRHCDTRYLTALCKHYQRSNICLVEDLAEAHGVKPHGYTDAACWSHYRNKVVSGEEGGTVWFRNPEHAVLARQLRSLGFTDAHDFTHIPRGVNARMSNVHASLILDSLRRIDLSLENRWLQWHTYNELCPREWRMARPDAPWVYAMRVKGMREDKQNAVVRALHADGVAARHCFKPCARQQEYEGERRVANCGDEVGWSNADVASWEVIYLPLSSYSTRCHLESFDVIQRILG